MRRLPLRRHRHRAGRRNIPVPGDSAARNQWQKSREALANTKKAVARIRVALSGPLYRAYRKPVPMASRKRSGGRRSVAATRLMLRYQARLEPPGA